MLAWLADGAARADQAVLTRLGVHQALRGQIEAAPTERPLLHGDIIFLRAHTWRMLDVHDGEVKARWNDRGAWQELLITSATSVDTGHKGNIFTSHQPLKSGDTIILQEASSNNCIDSMNTAAESSLSTSSLVTPPLASQTFVIEKEAEGESKESHSNLSNASDAIHNGDIVYLRACDTQSRVCVDDCGIVGLSQEDANRPHQRFRLECKFEALPEPIVVASSSASSVEAEEFSEECAICYSSLNENDAAMRCSGLGGQHHYFHMRCLREWIHTCHSQQREAKCPVCRQGLQAHQERLRVLLQDPSVSEDDRVLLEGSKIAGGQGWADFNVSPEVRKGLGIVAAVGEGVLQVTSRGMLGFQCHVPDDDGSGHTKIAHAVGVGLGIAFVAARALRS